MKKFNKMMLLSITALAPLATIVACSSTKTETFKLAEASATTKTAASTEVKMKITGAAKDAKAADFTLIVKEKDKTPVVEVKATATELKDEWLKFTFTNSLGAGKTYELVSVTYKTEKPVTAPTLEVVVEGTATA